MRQLPVTEDLGFGATKDLGFGVTEDLGFGVTEDLGFGSTEDLGFGPTEDLGFGSNRSCQRSLEELMFCNTLSPRSLVFQILAFMLFEN